MALFSSAWDPDLDPLDYFVWDRMVAYVYEEDIRDEAHLTQRIRRAWQVATALPS